MKILLLGDSQVGKTSIVRTFLRKPTKGNVARTVGIDYFCKTISVDDKKVKLGLWDTSGLNHFEFVTRKHYQGAKGIVIVVDLSREDGLKNVNHWLEEVRSVNESFVGILIGNKNDKERKISYDEGKEAATSLGLTYYETSCWDIDAVQSSFLGLISHWLEVRKTLKPRPKLIKKFCDLTLRRGDSTKSGVTDSLTASQSCGTSSYMGFTKICPPKGCTDFFSRMVDSLREQIYGKERFHRVVDNDDDDTEEQQQLVK
eukprot:CAMPEP_0114992236 /NCGR_PEP_ID=MMETSP0216-20121206/11825_1 /TAXON_ID=223996 /ORGANISM="Protocruzia adherens, Strain Boccale" /LENGTH=257 /DNA_ID=CAMNT_0002355671 /DNA_START=435 /DNA_END=1208 /DNA_ORIENTATION=-